MILSKASSSATVAPNEVQQHNNDANDDNDNDNEDMNDDNGDDAEEEAKAVEEFMRFQTKWLNRAWRGFTSDQILNNLSCLLLIMDF